MPCQNRRRRHLVALRILSILIISSATPCHTTKPQVDVVTVDDASSTGIFYTSPTNLSTVPPDSSDPNVPQWMNQNCNSCPSRPALDSLKNGTYTAVYIPPQNPHTYNITFQFTGTAIDVYLVLSKQAATMCSFVLDGNSTSWTGITEDEFQYNVLAFSEGGLDLRMHDLTISAVGMPDKPNYLNFDYAQLTLPNASPTAERRAPDGENATEIFSSLPSSTLPSSSLPTPSETSNPHITVKAIAGGVVGGFIAILLLILFASFYRNRRLRDLEQMAHPFATQRNSNVSISSISDEERLPLTHIAPSQSNRTSHRISHSHEPSRLSSQARTTPTPYTLHSPANSLPYQNPPPVVRFNAPHTNPEYRDQIREDRQRELHQRLETVTSQMRSLKTSYLQDQRRLQDQIQQQRAQDSRYTHNGRNYDPDPPVIRLVAGGMPDSVTGRGPGGVLSPDRQHTGEPMVNPVMLEDMRNQIQIMIDQIQYLRAQQNSPYTQGLTDEPPPGYVDVVSSYRGH